MRPLRLDHVAFWVAERERIAERCVRHLGMHVIDRRESFTLVGTDARHGKLTLFDAPGPRQPGAFCHLGLRVSDLGAARARLPAGAAESFDLGEGILVRLVEGETAVEYDLDHAALHAADPAAAASAYERYGLRREGEARVGVGGSHLEFVAAVVPPTDRPLLNHLALLVESADEHEVAAREAGIEIDSTVDAENTRAVFVQAPDGVRIEYVEHKPTFSLR